MCILLYSVPGFQDEHMAVGLHNGLSCSCKDDNRNVCLALLTWCILHQSHRKVG